MPATAQIKTGQQQADADSKDVQDNSKFVQYFLLGFGFIALGVGAFVIFNTLSITLAQRIRELATLRTLGASRRQIKRSVLTEGLAMGVFASVLGLVLGIALAKGLNALFLAFGIDLPQASMVIQPRTIVVALALGIVVTLLASVSPARRATRIAPVAALREGATLPPRLSARRPSIPIAILAVAAVLCLAGAFGGAAIGLSMILVGVGALALFLGVIMIAGRLVGPLARIVGAPARRFGGPAGRLASGNSTRNTTRTATTAAALMIGLALVTLCATLFSGFLSSTRSADEDAVSADYVVTSKSGFDTIPADVGTAVARAPGVKSVSAVRQDQAKAFGKTVVVNGLAPGFNDTVKLGLENGADAVIPRLGASGAIVVKSYADDHGLRVGSPLTLTTSAGRPVTVKVAAVGEPDATAHRRRAHLAGGLRRPLPAAERSLRLRAHGERDERGDDQGHRSRRRRASPRSTPTRGRPGSTSAARTRGSSSCCSTCCSRCRSSSACSGWSTRSCSRSSSAPARSG